MKSICYNREEHEPVSNEVSLVRALVYTEHACVLAALEHRSINRIRLRIEISSNGLKTL